MNVGLLANSWALDSRSQSDKKNDTVRQPPGHPTLPGFLNNLLQYISDAYSCRCLLTCVSPLKPLEEVGVGVLSSLDNVVRGSETPSKVRTVSFDGKVAPFIAATPVATTRPGISYQAAATTSTTLKVEPCLSYDDDEFQNELEGMLGDPDLLHFGSLMMMDESLLPFTLDELEGQRVAHRTRQVPPQHLPVMSPFHLKHAEKGGRQSGSPAVGPSTWLQDQVWAIAGADETTGGTDRATAAGASFPPNETDHRGKGLKNRRPRRPSKGKANPMTKHKHWTSEEDETLRTALADHAQERVNWSSIARTHFQGKRSSAQCKSRWKNVSLC
jgi:hypothetical protein